MPAILAIILIFLAFAVTHSLLAADRTKGIAIRLAGAGFVRAYYRLFYVAFSAVSASAAFYLIARLPDMTVWKPPLMVQAFMSLLQLAGAALGIAAFSGMDFLEFAGMRQAIRRMKKMDEPAGDAEGIRQRLVVRGLYGVIRHPLYAAAILVFSFMPVLTRNWVTVSALADLYFIWGALIEEKRLIKRFGQDYLEYMKKVPRFIPRF